MDPDDVAEGETVYYNGEAHTVTREFNGLNVQLENTETGGDLLVNPNAIDEEPPEEPDGESGSDGIPVTEINGLGPDMAGDLAAEGIETVQDVVDAGLDGLVAAGISEGWAENFVNEAEDLVG